MRRQPTEPYNSLPRGRLKLWRLLWVLVAAMPVALVSTLVYGVVQQAPTASRHTFTGEIRPVEAPISVFLPKGAFLEEILVERDETVYAGQTVAILDVEAIKAQLQNFEASLVFDDTLRSCLRGQHLSQGPQETSDGFSQSQQDGVLNAAEICAGQRNRSEDIEETYQEALKLLEDDEALLETYLQVLLEGTADEHNQNDQVRQILSLQFAQNRMMDRRLSLQADYQNARKTAQEEKDKQIREITKNLRVTAEMRRRLLKLLEEPRLLAPTAGYIVRMRHLPIGTSVTEDTEFLEIRPENTQGYLAEFPIAEHQKGFVFKGQDVEMDVIGMRERLPQLRGVVRQVAVDENGDLKAIVALHADSTNALDDPKNGVALRGDTTAANIRVHFSSYSASELIERDITGFLKSFGFQRKPEVPANNLSGSFAPRMPMAVSMIEGRSEPHTY